MNFITAFKTLAEAFTTGRIIDDEALAALTIWMEARGESQEVA